MPKTECPQCNGTGWRTIETRGERGVSRKAVPCECAAESRAESLLDRTRIPKRYLHCDFENYETDLPHEGSEAAAWNRSLQKARLVVQGFAREFPGGRDRGLLLMGPCGVGKTHLAVAALRELISRGHEGLFYDYRELLKEIQASYNPVSQTSEMEVLEPVLKTEVLLLDDLGASKPSAWVLDTVGHILNARYNENRPSILTTNFLDVEGSAPVPTRLPSGQPLPRAEDSLSDRLGQRIRSRLYEMCTTVEIHASDYRKEVRQAGRFRA
jgi:DNA replication protein DnaC